MILKMIYSTIILIFAIVGMTMLLDFAPVHLQGRKRGLYFGGISLIVVLSFFFMVKIKAPFMALYPLLVHLPLMLVFYFVSGRGLVKVLFVLLTMIFLSYPPSLVGMVAVRFFNVRGVPLLVILAASCTLTLLFIWKFMRKDLSYVMRNLSGKEMLRFCFVPIGYNIINYALGHYEYGATGEPVRIVLFLSALGVYSLLFSFFRWTREMEQVKSEKVILSMQMEAAKEQVCALRATQEQTMIYRHDLRHHLGLISSYAESGDLQKIKEYLCVVEEKTQAATPVRYCENETINLLLAAFAAKAEKADVALCMELSLPQGLLVEDAALCTLFSNALENAIHAAAQVEERQLRRVFVRSLVRDGKLMLSTENAYVGKVEMDGELPRAKCADHGHGFGIKSIVRIVEAYGGLYSFETADNVFVMQLMVPLQKQATKV